MSSRVKIIAWLLAALVLGSCDFGTAPGFVPLIPKIAYTTPVCDTVGRAAAHPVVSTGGSVSLYTVTPALPAGLALDSATGLIAGMPVAPQAPRDYTVIATGPEGQDSAVIRLWAVSPYNPSLAPSIVFESPVYDTVGTASSHPVYSIGGPVTTYTLLPALPAGLTLNATTGTVSGNPTAVSALTDYRVVASGPGGKDTATLRLAVVQRPSQQSSSARPSVAYDSPVYDTVGMAAAHPVVSVGGKVTSYTVIYVNGSDSLPKGLSLNKSTGLISGTPQTPDVVFLLKHAATGADLLWPPSSGYYSVRTTHYILATGPGGKDTASIDIDIAWPTGANTLPEFPYPGTGSTTSGISLTVNFSSRASTSPVISTKSAAVIPKKVIVTLTSNVSSDAVVRDTIFMSSSGLDAANSGYDQVYLSKFYALKPLRHWSVKVKVLDALDSVLSQDTVLAKNLLAGENKSVVLNLTSRFEAHRISFSLPDSIGSATSIFKQHIDFTRTRVTLDGIVVRDTVKSGGYFAPLVYHSAEYDYVGTGEHVWKVEVFGVLEGWPSSLPLFTGTVSGTKSGVVPMAWTGPGSASDPNMNGNVTGGTITTVAIVLIQKVNSVIFNTPDPAPLP